MRTRAKRKLNAGLESGSPKRHDAGVLQLVALSSKLTRWSSRGEASANITCAGLPVSVVQLCYVGSS